MRGHGAKGRDLRAGTVRAGIDGPPAERFIGDQLPVWLLRAGLAFVFLYAAAASFRDPTTFARYFPSFLPARLASDLLPVFAAFELILALSILTPRFTYVASLLAAITLVGIVAANLDAFEVLFRNVAIACAALALALQHRPFWVAERAAERLPEGAVDGART